MLVKHRGHLFCLQVLFFTMFCDVVQGLRGNRLKNLSNLRTLAFHATTFDYDFLTEFNTLPVLEYLSFSSGCNFSYYECIDGQEYEDISYRWSDFGGCLSSCRRFKTLGTLVLFLRRFRICTKSWKVVFGLVDSVSSFVSSFRVAWLKGVRGVFCLS